ncbi:MAG: MoaD/ThiS family protein [bacterium]|nr:MoaD/ThiS family protein [bacterium]
MIRSWEIIRYVDEQYPESGKRLVPDDPDLQRAVGAWTYEAGLREDAGLGTSLGTSISILSARTIRACIRQLRLWHVMWKFRRTLASDDGWLLGSFTMVDVMMMAHFHRLEDVALEQRLEQALAKG